MKKIILILSLLLPTITFSQVIMSWNIQYLGESKFKKDTIVPAIADVMIQSKADIISIQELVTNKYGDSCIIQLANILILGMNEGNLYKNYVISVLKVIIIYFNKGVR